MLAVLSGCGTFFQERDSAPERSMDWNNIPDAVPRNEPLSKRGNPSSYVVNGKRYFVNLDAGGFRQRGIASWYGTKFHGRATSSGEPYDMYKMTAAHKTLPLPSYVKVTNLDNGKQIVVKVNDRGPFVDERIIDLSYAAAKKLDITPQGTAQVEIEALNPARDDGLPASGGGTENSTAENNTEPADLNNYYVQLGAFAQRIRAEQLRDRLTQQSVLPVSVISRTHLDSDLFVVRVGPLAGKQQLKSMASRLSQLGYDNSYIVIE